MIMFDDGAGPQPSGAIKIIGIGQSLRGDDGAGLAAVRLWIETYQKRDLHADVQVELVELPGIGLIDLLQGAAIVIIVDAVSSGAVPGTLHQLDQDQLESLAYGFASGSGSAHGWGVAETLSLGRKLMSSQMPSKLVLIGIEVGQVNLGEDLSPAVLASLPDAAQLIEQYVNTALEK